MNCILWNDHRQGPGSLQFCSGGRAQVLNNPYKSLYMSPVAMLQVSFKEEVGGGNEWERWLRNLIVHHWVNDLKACHCIYRVSFSSSDSPEWPEGPGRHCSFLLVSDRIESLAIASFSKSDFESKTLFGNSWISSSFLGIKGRIKGWVLTKTMTNIKRN